MRVCDPIWDVAIPELPLFEQFEARVVAGINDIAKEFMGVLLVTTAEMFGKNPERGMDL